VQLAVLPTSARDFQHVPQRVIFGAFTKSLKVIIGFAMSVRPTVRMEQLGSHWTDLHKI
jgi:hypothetical protein